MGGLFSGGLTKENTALTMPGGGTAYFPDAEQATRAATATIPTPRQLAPLPQLGETSPAVSPASAATIRTPSFKEVAVDRSTGDVRPGITKQPTTKLGSLMKVLMGGAQGGLDAIQAGALDAPVHGESPITKGVYGALQMPNFRKQQAQAIQHQDIQNRLGEFAVSQIPVQQTRAQIGLEGDIAQINETQARTRLLNAQREAAMLKGNTPEEIIAQKSAIAQRYGLDPEQTKEFVFGIKPTKETDAAPHTKDMAEGVMQWDGKQWIRVGGLPKTVAPAININANKNASEEDVKIAAQQLADPRNLTALRDITGWGGDKRLKVFAEAKRINPNFDPGVVNHRIKFLQSYEDPKGRASINRQAINNILQHGADLLDLNNQYRARSEFRPLNTPINALANAFGSQVYTQFSTVNSVLKDELALYFAGGYAPTVDQKAMWEKIQSDQATPAQTEAFAREVGRLAFRRANTFNAQFKKNMGYDDPDLINEEAKNAAVRMGLGKEVEKFGSGGSPFSNVPSTGGDGWQTVNGIRVRRP